MKIIGMWLASVLLLAVCAGPASAAGTAEFPMRRGGISGAALMPKGFAFSSISNRFITPNGDGLNDTVVFAFENPQAGDVRGKIYDVRGALVASLGPVTGTSLAWDGKSWGQTVAGGVYIYVIEAQTGRHSGTVVIVR